MSDEAFDAEDTRDTLWTEKALADYRAAVQELVTTVDAHAELVGARVGRQRELPGYLESAEELQRAVNAFAEAEFDWCGSFPVRSGELDDEGLDVDDSSDDGALEAPAAVVTVLCRYDYDVTDAAALVDHGRSAYLQRWEVETLEDAQLRVEGPLDAVREVLHEAVLVELEDTPGLRLTRWVSQLVQHGGSPDDEIEEDPFGIVQRV